MKMNQKKKLMIIKIRNLIKIKEIMKIMKYLIMRIQITQIN